jgi:hypothetical protein
LAEKHYHTLPTKRKSENAREVSRNANTDFELLRSRREDFVLHLRTSKRSAIEAICTIRNGNSTMNATHFGGDL